MKKDERRTGERARAVIPIGVRIGERKLTAGCTLDAGPTGALILCTENVAIGTELHVTNLQSDEWFTCRVVRTAGKHESGRHALGVEILGTDVKEPEPADATSTTSARVKKRKPAH
ncbi:MAG: PilZ domain-containing protein [Acidobacteria bacterium]|nr:PilZ domain-containing protein [Acidobacteriota bacterium]